MDLLAVGIWKTQSLQSGLVLITHQSGKEDAKVLRGRIIGGGTCIIQPMQFATITQLQLKQCLFEMK